MFRYNPAANYQPNGDRYLQILSGKDLYKQTIVVSAMKMRGYQLLFLQDFQIFLLIILQGKCMLGINCGQTGIKLHYIFIISQLRLTSHPRSRVVLLDTETPGTSREIYSEDADGETRTRNPWITNPVL